MAQAFRFAAQLWEHDGPAAWFFVSLPTDIADEIADLMDGRVGGFGSVRVHVALGAARWSTSLFPDTKRGTYVLPIKKAVRLSEDLHPGTDCTVELEVA